MTELKNEESGEMIGLEGREPQTPEEWRAIGRDRAHRMALRTILLILKRVSALSDEDMVNLLKVAREGYVNWHDEAAAKLPERHRDGAGLLRAEFEREIMSIYTPKPIK